MERLYIVKFGINVIFYVDPTKWLFKKVSREVASEEKCSMPSYVDHGQCAPIRVNGISCN